MTASTRFLIGLALALALGLVSHGPLGRGEAFVAGLETQARNVLREAGLPGVSVSFPRSPLARRARLSGAANDFQREGMGELPGINDRIRGISGVSGLVWIDGDCCARNAR